MRPHALIFGVVFFSALTLAAPARTASRDPISVRDHVLDLTFPTDAGITQWGYHFQLTLRFSDTSTQLVVRENPIDGCVLVRYELANMDADHLLKLVTTMLAENPDIDDREIAAKIKAEITQSPIDCKVLDRSLEALRKLRLSPIIATRVGVDSFTRFDLLFDTGQESVHYRIIGPFEQDPQDKLVQWMLRFRTTFAKANTGAK